MAGEEREVVARLKLEKAGDEAAFADAVADLEELAGVGPNAAKEVAKVGDAAADAAGGAAELGGAAATAAGQLQGLSTAASSTAGEVKELSSSEREAAKIMEEFGLGANRAGAAGKNAAEGQKAAAESADHAAERFSNLAGKAVLVVSAFQSGFEAGKLLREGLNDLTDDGLDRAVQGLIDFHLRAAAADDSAEDLANNAQRLANNIRILKANGIDPTNLSLAEMDALVEKVSRAKHDAAATTADATKAEEEYAKSLGLSEKALGESAKKLTDFIANFAKANQQLADQDLGKLFKGPLQEILDGFERLGKEAPKPLQDLARQFGVMSSSVEKDAAKTTTAVEAMYDSIVGGTKTFAGTLEKQGEVIRAVFAQLTPKDVTFGSEGLERAKAILQEYVNESRKAGQQIPADIAAQSLALGILVSGYEIAEGASQLLIGAQNRVGQSVTGAKVALDEQAHSISNTTNQAKASSVAFDEQSRTLKSQEGAVKQSTVVWDEAAKTLKSVEDGQKAVGDAATEAGTKVKEGADAAAEGAASLAETAEAGKEAGAGLGTVKAEAEGLGKAGAAGAAGVDQISTSMQTLLDSIPSVADAFAKMRDTKLDALKGEVASVTGAVDNLIGRLEVAKEKLDGLDGASA